MKENTSEQVHQNALCSGESHGRHEEGLLDRRGSQGQLFDGDDSSLELLNRIESPRAEGPTPGGWGGGGTQDC